MVYTVKDLVVGENGARAKMKTLFTLTDANFIVGQEKALRDAINTALGYTASDYTYYIPCDAKNATMRAALVVYLNAN